MRYLFKRKGEMWCLPVNWGGRMEFCLVSWKGKIGVCPVRKGSARSLWGDWIFSRKLLDLVLI